MTYKRKEIIGDCTVYQGSCVDILPSLEKIDLVITDPPYGDGENAVYGLYDKQIQGNESPILNCQVISGLYHCLRRNGTIYNFAGWKHVDFLKHYVHQYTNFKVRHNIIWAKNHFGLGGAFRPAYEVIMVLEKGKPFYLRKDFGDVQSAAIINHNANTHPHEKPVSLIQRLIAHSSHDREMVFDPFMGSGTTGVACAKMGRRFIGIEIDEGYFDMACKRIEAAYKQGDIFTETPKKAVQETFLE